MCSPGGWFILTWLGNVIKIRHIKFHRALVISQRYVDTFSRHLDRARIAIKLTSFKTNQSCFQFKVPSFKMLLRLDISNFSVIFDADLGRAIIRITMGWFLFFYPDRFANSLRHPKYDGFCNTSLYIPLRFQWSVVSTCIYLVLPICLKFRPLCEVKIYLHNVEVGKYICVPIKTNVL